MTVGRCKERGRGKFPGEEINNNININININNNK